MSAPPPAGNGTTKRIGLVGHSDCARAEKGREVPSAIEPAALIRRRRGSESRESQDCASHGESTADAVGVFERIMMPPVEPVTCIGHSAKREAYKLSLHSGQGAAALTQQTRHASEYQPYRTGYRDRMRSIRIGRCQRVNRLVDQRWHDDNRRTDHARRTRIERWGRLLDDRQLRRACAPTPATHWRRNQYPRKRWHQIHLNGR